MFVFFTIYTLGFQPKYIYIGSELFALVCPVPAIGANVVGFIDY